MTTSAPVAECARAAYQVFRRTHAANDPRYRPGGRRAHPPWARLDPRLKVAWIAAAYAARWTPEEAHE